MDEIERLNREYDLVEEERSRLWDEFFSLQRRRDVLLDQLEREENPRIKAEIRAHVETVDGLIGQNRDKDVKIDARLEDIARDLRQEEEFRKRREQEAADLEEPEPPKIDPEKGFDTDDWEEQRRLYMERKRKLKR